jgi:excisionase family DNA binding protein
MKPTTKRPHEAHPTDLLDIHEAGELLCLKPATLRRWTFTRRISFVRVGARAVRFRRADLEQFIADGQRPALRPIDGR